MEPVGQNHYYRYSVLITKSKGSNASSGSSSAVRFARPFRFRYPRIRVVMAEFPQPNETQPNETRNHLLLELVDPLTHSLDQHGTVITAAAAAARRQRTTMERMNIGEERRRIAPRHRNVQRRASAALIASSIALLLFDFTSFNAIQATFLISSLSAF